MQRVGFIGLGNMGMPMAANLLKGGFPLTVYDVRTELIPPLVEKGAKAAANCQEVALSSDVVITMLPSSPDVEKAILGPEGVIEGVREGSIVIDMSTIAPSMTRKVADRLGEKGARMIDAPVTRGVAAAVEGKIAVLVGGDRDLMDECMDVLRAMASDVYYTGELGCGEVTKIVHNLILGIFTPAIAEALVLGVKAGVKPEVLVEVIGTGPANSGVLQRHYKQNALRGDFEGIFPVEYIMKDLGLALQLGQENSVPMQFGSLAYQTYMAAKAAGKGKKFHPVVLTQLEELTGVKVRLEE